MLLPVIDSLQHTLCNNSGKRHTRDLGIIAEVHLAAQPLPTNNLLYTNNLFYTVRCQLYTCPGTCHGE